MSNPVPGLLYKYLRVPYADAMVTTGSVRIGTLREYRNTEEYGVVVGDADEGVTSAVDADSELPPARISPSPPGRFGFLTPGDERLTSVSIYATEDYIQFVEEWPDSYVYCLSQKLNAKLMTAFDADAVVEVREPLRFFCALTRSLRRRVKIATYFFGSCGYQSRVRSLEDRSFPPAFIKDPSYSYQREARGVWLPGARPDTRDAEIEALVRKGYGVSLPPSQNSDGELNPLIIRCRAITQYCSLVSL